MLLTCKEEPNWGARALMGGAKCQRWGNLPTSDWLGVGPKPRKQVGSLKLPHWTPQTPQERTLQIFRVREEEAQATRGFIGACPPVSFLKDGSSSQ